MKQKSIKLFLRISISIGFLSAVADRFGIWNENVSAWGNWRSFLEYTQLINPFIPESLISFIAIIATAGEVFLALCLIIGFKTEFMAKMSGYLLLLFAISMTFSTGLKGVLDYSVFIAAAGAFGLSTMKEKSLELDVILNQKK